MQLSKSVFNTLLDIVVILVSVVIGYWLHSNTFLDVDVAWHVEGARRLLAGGNYLLNVFDDNAPFVFAFYFPVVWVQKLTHFGFAPLIILYVLCVSSFFLLLSRLIVNKVFPSNDIASQKLFFYTLIYSLIFLPAVSLGQREMVLINFTLPYLLLNIFSTTQAELQFNKFFKILLALFAAFGVMQNIIFIVVFVGIDLFRYFKLRKVDVQQIVFYTAILLQGLLVWLMYPEYLLYIIPLLLCYGPGFNSDTVELFLYPYIVWLTFGLAFYVLTKRYAYSMLMFLVAMLLSLLIYLFEQKIWYSHLYPAVFFAMLVLALILIEGFKKNYGMVVTCLAVAIFITMMRNIVLSADYEWQQFHNPHSQMRTWVNYAQQHFRSKKVFYLIVNDYQGYTLPLYDDAITVSPWFNPWFVPYILQRQKHEMGYFCHPDKDTRLFISIISKSIASTNPDFIVVNIPSPKIELQGFNRLFTQKNIQLLLHDYFAYDHFLKNTVFKHR